MLNQGAKNDLWRKICQSHSLSLAEGLAGEGNYGSLRIAFYVFSSGCCGLGGGVLCGFSNAVKQNSVSSLLFATVDSMEQKQSFNSLRIPLAAEEAYPGGAFNRF